MMLYREPSELKNFIKILVKNKISFRHEETKNTDTIKILDENGKIKFSHIFTENITKDINKLFIAFQQLKSHIKSKEEYIKNKKEITLNDIHCNISHYKTRYIYFDQEKRNEQLFKEGYEGVISEYNNIIEFDVTKAYFSTAKFLGYIDAKIYNKLVNLPKDHRLKILGMLATKKIITTYTDGEKGDNPEIKKWDIGVKVFNDCAKVNDFNINIVRETINFFFGNDLFLFYWVDAIFLKKPPEPYYTLLKNLIKRAFEGLDFQECKFIEHEKLSIEIKEKAVIYKIINGNKKKIYFAPKKQVSHINIEISDGVNILSENIENLKEGIKLLKKAKQWKK
jgi:hypothetical protein